ncbi:MAG: hypothetical protein Q8J74_09660, partial [Candidatus Didemnitutus sp.]|nr:hypothetical protein [Candidatus Didemnitutus sp.]
MLKLQPESPRSRSGPFFGPGDDPASRSIAIGVLCTLVFHVLLVVLAPYFPVESMSGTHSNLA